LGSVLVERKYRALPQLEIWESLFDMNPVDRYDVVRDVCGIIYENMLCSEITKSCSHQTLYLRITDANE